MRVTQIVTLVSPDGAFGGPVTVATNQLAELQRRGHTVQLHAGLLGYRNAPAEIEGVPLCASPTSRILPGAGFSGLAAPRMMRDYLGSMQRWDVVHIHLTRDLITLPLAWRTIKAGVPVVLQTHGMIDESSRYLARPLDALLTRRVLRRAQRVFYLTEHERAGLEAVAGKDVPLKRLVNGVPDPGPRRHASGTGRRDVIYLARLHPRKGAEAFTEAALSLARRWPGVRFTLVGPDEGSGLAVTRLISRAGSDQVKWIGAVDHDAALSILAGAYAYVLPSVDEPFPMSVLEAASFGVPVLITRGCGLSSAVSSHGAGLIIEPSATSIEHALDRILDDAQLHDALAASSKRMAVTSFSMSAVVDQLEQEYERISASRFKS